jgi:hypothetical protein
MLMMALDGTYSQRVNEILISINERDFGDGT